MGTFPSIDPQLIPIIAIISLPGLYLASRIYARLTKPDPAKTGFGRGAPGFQTSVRKVAIPAHLAARIRAGEEVTAEEVTEALEEERQRLDAIEKEEEETKRKQEMQQKKIPAGVDQDWLPEGALSSGTGSKGGKRRKK